MLLFPLVPGFLEAKQGSAKIITITSDTMSTHYVLRTSTRSLNPHSYSPW